MRRSFKVIAFHIPLEYVIRKAKGNEMGQQLSGTHQLVVYAD
jgi:hypothetical protein